MATPASQAMEVEAEVTLTELEQKVFKALLDTISHFGLGTTVRAAGGWVRDKLLRTFSDDIDIVVDNMSGEEFALKVCEFMSQNAAGDMVSTVGVVKQNPDQSKHLATACFRLYGLSLDVNNLRTETYTEDSRIPATSIGTPTEDAQRRDFTVNALFFNINDSTVEDFTGSGLADMRVGVMRTPLPARETFQDDPLRMLRAIRFAARLGFSMDEGLVAALSDPALHHLLETKVSRERFGIEVDKMMKAPGARPIVALEMMQRLSLLGPIFLSQELLAAVPPDQPPLAVADMTVGVERARAVADVLLVEEPGQELRFAMYAALLSAWAGRTLPEKKKQKPLIPALLRAALKIECQACEAVQEVAAAAEALLGDGELAGAERSRLVGEQLRRTKERWPQALALSRALGGARGDAVRQAFLEGRAWIQGSGLVGCWDWKPLIDGKQLMSPPFSIPKGRKVGEAMDMQLQWRLEHPELTEEACAQRIHELVSSWK